MGSRPASRVEAALYELCAKGGYCLPPEAYEAILEAPPATADAWVEAVLQAEGFDLVLVDRNAKAYVRNVVREWLFDDGKGKGTKSGLPWRAEPGG